MADNRIPNTSSDPRRPGRRGDGDARVTRVDVDTRGSQLEHRTLGSGDQFRRLPQLSGHRDGGGFISGQVDCGQRVRIAVDSVALGGVERRGLAGLQRDAEVPQLVLVTLEHSREGFVAGAVGVPGDRLADALCGEIATGGQQRDDEVHQALDFGDPHGFTA
jgi:hypothetical protein